MKVLLIAALTALITHTGTAIAQSGDMKGMDMKPAAADKKAQSGDATDPHAGHMPAAKQTKGKFFKASGVVKKIDTAKGGVTLAHGPVPDLKWPAMTMGFTVKDKALFDKLAVGKKVDFEFVQQKAGYVITSVK